MLLNELINLVEKKDKTEKLSPLDQLMADNPDAAGAIKKAYKIGVKDGKAEAEATSDVDAPAAGDDAAGDEAAED
jgi:hypothetical protein